MDVREKLVYLVKNALRAYGNDVIISRLMRSGR